MSTLYPHAGCFLVAGWLLYLQVLHPHSRQEEWGRVKVKLNILFVRIENSFLINLHSILYLRPHQSEVGHMATFTCKGSWDVGE